MNWKSKNAVPSRGEYNVYSTFQSHEPEFDYLKSLEIEEKINKIRWLQQTNRNHFLLSTNGEHTVVCRLILIGSLWKGSNLHKCESWDIAFHHKKKKEVNFKTTVVNLALKSGLWHLCYRGKREEKCQPTRTEYINLSSQWMHLRTGYSKKISLCSSGTINIVSEKTKFIELCL